MKQYIYGFMKALAVVTLLVAPVVAGVTSEPAAAAPVSAINCEQRFLGLPAWNRGITKAVKNECVILGPDQIQGGLSGMIWKIALNIIEIGLFIVGYIAVFFILYGGFQFLTGGSVPGQIEKARKTILNAVIGLAISMGAIGITNLVFGVLGK